MRRNPSFMGSFYGDAQDESEPLEDPKKKRSDLTYKELEEIQENGIDIEGLKNMDKRIGYNVIKYILAKEDNY